MNLHVTCLTISESGLKVINFYKINNFKTVNAFIRSLIQHMKFKNSLINDISNINKKATRRCGNGTEGVR